MGSRFADRLDFLMSLTNTTNSALARELLFDPSYISRIRNGKRGAPIHQPFIKPAALYLAKRIREPYQKQAAVNALNLHGAWPESHEEAARRIERWLRDDTAMFSMQFNKLFERMPQELSQSQRNLLLNTYSVDAGTEPDDSITIVNTCFSGKSGKRQAATRLMNTLLEDDESKELWLYTDEDRSWLSEDPEFSNAWISMLSQFTNRGGKIISIQSTIRTEQEILTAVSDWVPLYFTGRIESYYCPQLTLGACHRTLVVCPGKIVLSANSVMDQTASMINALSTDSTAIRAGEVEFENLMKYSTPYVKSSVLSDEEATNALFEEFFAEEGTLTVVRNSDIEAIVKQLDGSIPASTSKIINKGLIGASRLSSSVMPDHIVMAMKGDHAFAIMNISKPRGLMLVTEGGMASALTEFLKAVPAKKR